MLNALARELDLNDFQQHDEKQRPDRLQRALRDVRALLLFDNLESLPEEDRARLFDFLSRLPRGGKAVVTSRRRTDIDARVVRLDRLSQEAALAFIERLAEDRPLLGRASEADRIALYTGTGGNPLLIRWVAGQLGRSGCRDLAAALALLVRAGKENDPLEFIFGDLVDTFTPEETKVLAALSHFTLPAGVKHLAELSGLAAIAAETALEDLADRALVVADPESRTFLLLPLVAQFLRNKRPEAVSEAGQRLTDRAYALAVENGYDEHDRFPVLAQHWPVVAAALPLLLQGPNDRLQTVCATLNNFLNFSGRWDEWRALELQAEERVVAVGDYHKAGWRASQAGFCSSLRRDAREVLACAERAAAHWREANAGTRERAMAIRLHGLGHELAGDNTAALAAYREAVELHRSLTPESRDVAIVLDNLAGIEKRTGDFAGAERDRREALRINKAVDNYQGVAICTGNLAALALDQEDWPTGETLAREALSLSEKVGRSELIAEDCRRLAQALARQGRKTDALPYARRAVEIYTALRSPDLDGARRTLAECES